MVIDHHPWSIDYAWRYYAYSMMSMWEFLNNGINMDGFDVLHPRSVPPPRLTFMLNTDESFDPRNGALGDGGVIRGHDGVWVRSFHSHLAGGGDPFLCGGYYSQAWIGASLGL